MTGPDHDVLVIGGGFSGIGAAILLDKAGFSDYLVLEEGDGVGGAWHWNTYPGVAVDIPSFSYQFSFEKRTTGAASTLPARSWGVRRALRAQVRAGRPTRFGSARRRHVRRATTRVDVTTARRRRAHRAARDQRDRRPDQAQGAGHPRPRDFAGETVHTARWDHDLDLRGKRVGVIGTGASAVQLIPAIAEEVEHLTVFQRTPIWCLPKPDAAMPSAHARVLRRVPGAKRLARLASQTYVELTFPLAAHFHHPLHLAAPGEKLARKALKEQVHDPVVREKLTPKYAVGCKRPSFHNSYLSTFNRDDVFLETDPIARDHAERDRHEHGTEHQIDVLVLATGFKVFERDNMPASRATAAAATWRLVGREPGTGLRGRQRAGLPEHVLDPRALRVQRLVVLQPDRDPDGAHRPLPAARRASAARPRSR